MQNFLLLLLVASFLRFLDGLIDLIVILAVVLTKEGGVSMSTKTIKRRVIRFVSPREMAKYYVIFTGHLSLSGNALNFP